MISTRLILTFFFSSPILFSNREENHIGMLRAELGYALIYTYFPPSWLQLLYTKPKKKKDTSQLWGQKVQHTMRAKKNII